MYLLDTNVVSELRRGHRAAPNVQAWNANVEAETCYLSAVTLFELRLGALLKQRHDRSQGDVLLAWIDRVQAGFRGRIVDVDSEHWRRCAELHVPDPRPLRDSLIGTCALIRGLTIVTRNERDFGGLGVQVLNPWITVV